ncbi:MAG: Cyclic di-GMP phosphodiesterase response regulator RpfG [Pelotomaculum sp. PtaB.Bin013]|uniref:HD-GYP domain-containing protein n=1 Tax=Pelotomaculum isophthalicicum JI TaxID=947010 RepID=A0A9X4H3H8_9FIRM|nr:HD-GYP domain-containing protein [Pelotomaculum isophthalicicum]MDF9409106.1 HD-GYP domain-containing protein [Pelotomaculum isophthalicicum JI]OPX89961.1 MAG: Cyclic di-GMP phosphodiesterase response regulator RpfG [Pelotomaculum sp. PtaB.Bin013]
MQKNLDLLKARDELRNLNKNLETIVRERTFSLQTEVKERKSIEEDLKKSFNKLKRTMEGTVKAIALMIEMRDPYTAGHERRVAKLATAIANEMGLSKEQIDEIRMAGFLHDIGKIVVPAEILCKPGCLNENEFGIIKTHPRLGYEIIKDIEFPCTVAKAILQHHERLDGTGYPGGLMGEDIILEAKIISVADVVEAISSHRPYRPAMGFKNAISEIIEKKNVLYDPHVVDACVRLINEKNFQL